MKRWLVVFEDDAWRSLSPLADLTPVPELAFGGSNLATRWRSAAGLRLLAVHARPQLQAARRSPFESNFSAAADKDEVLLVNAAALPGPWLTAALSDVGPARFMAGERVVGARLPAEQLRPLLEAGESFPAALRALTLPAVAAPAHMLTYPWELIERNAAAIESDLAGQSGAIRGEVHAKACLIEERRITIETKARVDPFAVLDARAGPIRIETGAIIARAHAWSRARASVGAGTQLLGGLIARSTVRARSAGSRARSRSASGRATATSGTTASSATA